MTVAEDESISFTVFYADSEELSGVNLVAATGDNMNAVADGNELSITPDADFDGEIQVTVTVDDVENSTDQASTSFMLTVTGDGVDEAAAQVAAAQASSAAEEDAKSTNSGGSMGLFMMIMLGLIGFRRKVRFFK